MPTQIFLRRRMFPTKERTPSSGRTALQGGLHAGQTREAGNLVMPRPDGDGLPGRLDHQAGGENRVLGKMERENPVAGEVHLTSDAGLFGLHHAIDLEHVVDRQINLGEVVSGING